jgi:sugar lactone lactonase YvrE
MLIKKLDLINFSSKELYAHGSSIIEYPDDPTHLMIAMINHLKTGSVVELFSYHLGSNVMLHLETVADPSITRPNDVALVQNENSMMGSFYVTSEGEDGGYFARNLETYLRLKNGRVLYRFDSSLILGMERVKRSRLLRKELRSPMELSQTTMVLFYLMH